MENKNEMRYDGSFSKLRTGMDILMGILYIFVGVLIIFVKSFGSKTFPATLAYLFGGLIILYGLFRLFNGYNQIKNKNN